MTPVRRHPRLLEVNARLWLSRIRASTGRPVTIGTVPETDLAAIARHFDLLWVMGLWRRSSEARTCALTSPALVTRYDAALPGWTAADVAGSPYAIHRYELDPALGSPEELGVFRHRLNRHGVGLIVDFVANHLARDHPWTAEHPEWFVGGDQSAPERQPEAFFRTSTGVVLAHGRDPHLSPWTDTAQVDLGSPAARTALTRELAKIAASADGARCDMAMLGLSSVFARTWSPVRPGPKGGQPEFWDEAIALVRSRHPSFLFMAEAYWGLERDLLARGFDFAYDKRFYDLLVGGAAGALRDHLRSAGPLLVHGARFIENHDEPRAQVTFGPRGRMAAAAMLTVPGLRLIHDGQADGRRAHLPVQLIRAPDEPLDHELSAYYEDLLALTRDPLFYEGVWRLVDVEPSSPGDGGHHGLVAWSWALDTRVSVVVVNLSGAPASGVLRLPEETRTATGWRDRLAISRPPSNEGSCLVQVDAGSARVLSGVRN